MWISLRLQILIYLNLDYVGKKIVCKYLFESICLFLSLSLFFEVWVFYWIYVATLALGMQPRQGLAKVWAKSEVW